MPDLSSAHIGEFIDAVVHDPAKATRMLSDKPALLNARWILGETVIHFLAVEGYANGVRFLAEQGADVNATNEFGDSPLVEVAALGSDAIAEVLLHYGADPNFRSSTWDNALCAAIRSGNSKVVDLLLRSGSDGEYVTDLGHRWFDALPESADQRDSIVEVFAKHGIRRTTVDA